MRTRIIFCLQLAIMLLVSACGDNGGGNDAGGFTEKIVNVSGKVEKGPFVRGSRIELRTLDAKLSANGNSFTAGIEDNAGTFHLGDILITSPYAKISADGYFFNEVRGELSTGTIHLEAYANLANHATLNVNILTHLKSKRVARLVASGKSFSDADSQAQNEVLKAFGLAALGGRNVSQFSITGGDDAAAALVAVSSLVLADRSEAQIVEYLDQLTSELGNTGRLSDASKAQMRTDLEFLKGNRLSDIAENVVRRYRELGITVVLKDLSKYFDWDNNGVAGDEQGPVALDRTEFNVPYTGGRYVITAKSDVPLYFDAPNGEPSDVVVPEDIPLYDASDNADYSMSIDKSISGRTITIIVGEAHFGKAKTVVVPLYDVLGTEVATITLHQEGNPNVHEAVVPLGEAGLAQVCSFMKSVDRAFYFAWGADQEYWKSRQPDVAATSPQTEDAWRLLYDAIEVLTSLKKMDASYRSVYQDYLNVHLALAYLILTSYWGDVPFYMDADNSAALSCNRDVIQTLLIETLKNTLPRLDNGTYHWDEIITGFFDQKAVINDVFMLKKEPAYAVLAKLYMECGNYVEAKELYRTIVDSRHDALKKSQEIVYAFNSECIYSYYVPITPRAVTLIHNSNLLDYKDVLLDYAECCHRTDDDVEAWRAIETLCDAKGLSINPELSVSREVIFAIALMRREMSVPYTLPFVRRNGLWDFMMGTADDKYLFYPVPAAS